MKLEEVEREISMIVCPICGVKNFDIKLRCDLDYDRCHITLRCRHCRHEFEAASLVNATNHDHWDE